jgi:hypothetical protein
VKSDTTTTATAQFTYGPSAPQITSVENQPGGGFLLTFVGNAGESYTVRATSDLSVPLSNWAALTNGTFATNAATFLDSSATNLPRRFYIITMP